MSVFTSAVLNHSAPAVNSGRVPRPLYNAFMAASKGMDLSEVESAELKAVELWICELIRTKHEVTCFEFIRGGSQKGAAYLWQRALFTAHRAVAKEFRSRWANAEQLALELADANSDSVFGVICREHGKQGLTKDQYVKQLSRPDSLWTCPICSDNADWDDERYEAGLEALLPQA